jgi:hypothetical protein
MTMTKHPRIDRLRLFSLLSLLAGAHALQAQASSQTSAASDTAGGKVVLDELVVTNEKSIGTTLPVRPASSVYGFDTPVQDVPRSITQINPTQFNEDLIGSYSDFQRYSPSVNQATGQLSNYGSPTIRGSISDVLQNGVRMLVRQSNNRPFTLNAYESADIVAGPAPVIYGPSARTAGYVNYLTKKAYFDRQHTTLNLSLGKVYLDGTDYHQSTNWQVDTGAPIIPGKLAYRISYQGEKVDSYYRNSGDSYHDLFGTLAWVPSKDLTVDWNFEYGTFDWVVNNGLNRVTNDLIRNGTYLAGAATPVIQGAFSGTATGYYSPVWVSGVGFDGQHWVKRTKSGNQYTVGAALTGTPTSAQAGTIVGYVLDPLLVAAKPVDGSQALNVSPDAPSTTKAFNTQFRVKKVLTEDLVLFNNTIYQYYKTDTSSNGGFYNWITDHTLENRTELQAGHSWNPFGGVILHESNTGFSYRFEQVLNYKDAQKSGYGPTGDQYDVFADPSTFTRNAFFGTMVFPFTGTATTPVLTRFGYLKGFYPYLTVPESPVNAVSPGGSDSTQPWLSSTTNHTWVNSYSVYTQHSFHLGERWLADLGARETLVTARIRNPLALNSANAAIGESRRDVLPGYSASLSYKPFALLTLYTTYSYVEAQNGMTTGSPTWATVNGVANRLDPNAFRSLSELREAGAKSELLPGRLFAGVSVYSQTRDLSLQTVPGSDPVQAKGQYRGGEANLRWQPARGTSIGVNYSYLQARSLNQGVSTALQPVADGVTNILGTTALGFGNWRVTNLPRNNLTLYISHRFASGFGVKADAWARDSYIVTADGSVSVPGGYTLNVGVFYDRPSWRVSLDLQNATNQRNFAGGSTQLEPAYLQARYTYRF